VNNKEVNVGYVYSHLAELDKAGQLKTLEDWMQGRLPTSSTVTRGDRSLPVTVPLDEETTDASIEEPLVRESYQIQGLLAKIGERMGFQVWIPKRDRGSIVRLWEPQDDALLDRVPLNYNEIVLNTIEEIDVLWTTRQSIIRAFEVEHTTSIFSGLLRMADLLSLVPNLEMKLHIVAPDNRKRVFVKQITRPVFNYLEKAPLADVCSFLTYSAIREISELSMLQHAQHTLIDDFIESVTDMIE
jgi:hypothetical protein